MDLQTAITQVATTRGALTAAETQVQQAIAQRDACARAHDDAVRVLDEVVDGEVTAKPVAVDPLPVIAVPVVDKTPLPVEEK